MTRFTVVVAATAERHIRIVNNWWIEQRSKAPDLFTTELRATLERLETLPSSGAGYADPRIPDLRRILLKGSRYHVYYTIDDATRTVTVRAVWHAARHGRPDLG